ncbi:hypothetical protein N656DRAFT_413497 [Canariomyces notabilis]|uniref:Uncharacterized protein n=1 Tax=Canariomyces notabilis TaxID=2074819 RepID=A0AAN6QEB7_9PEZI|nr:hypothetical protein N656DRAFT_413497 [Canariomyces arenarius]
MPLGLCSRRLMNRPVSLAAALARAEARRTRPSLPIGAVAGSCRGRPQIPVTASAYHGDLMTQSLLRIRPMLSVLEMIVVLATIVVMIADGATMERFEAVTTTAAHSAALHDKMMTVPRTDIPKRGTSQRRVPAGARDSDSMLPTAATGDAGAPEASQASGKANKGGPSKHRQSAFHPPSPV